jgi:hypothetical protein
MTQDEIFAQNMQTARRVIGERLGVNPNNLTFTQREEYIRALAAYVMQFPAAFAPLTVTAAQRIATLPPSMPLADTSFSWSDFGGGILDNAEKVNPLSEQNRGKTSWWIMLTLSLVAVLGFAVFAAKVRPRS